MNAGDMIELSIASIAFGGAGVGRVNDFVVFVPFTIPGEKVRAEILKMKPNFAEAKPLAILEPSPLRIQPRCRYFGICGGCVYQHLPYSEQLKLKTAQVREVYRHLTGMETEHILEACPSPKEFAYRTKIRMKLKLSKFRSAMGYFDYYENGLEDVDTCPIASERLNAHLAFIRGNDFDFFRSKNVRSYNYAFMDTGDGIIDNLGPNQETRTDIEGKIFYHTRETFFQINHSIFSDLFREINRLLSDQDIAFDSFLDLYCGVGFFGIALSQYFKKLYFIEENRASFKLLEKNLSANGLTGKSKSFCGSADKAIKMMNELPEVILMDPPRVGATPESVSLIASMNPRVILYVSCNPSTQCRDAKLFAEKGYGLCYIKPFDFFPQTKHIETLAVFKKI